MKDMKSCLTRSCVDVFDEMLVMGTKLLESIPDDKGLKSVVDNIRCLYDISYIPTNYNETIIYLGIVLAFAESMDRRSITFNINANIVRFDQNEETNEAIRRLHSTYAKTNKLYNLDALEELSNNILSNSNVINQDEYVTYGELKSPDVSDLKKGIVGGPINNSVINIEEIVEVGTPSYL